uniref:NADH-ubiquinone oxidoreductase chain 4L n=1 Tax=Zancudomyces culisetae TaxID=1213189 RepID=Q3T4B5_ZANCU|nr:NADH dehydrogenase subunit 4L [Zancudomyces culisetae]AAW49499.1 NADH dehydrogenase subunit 4L [Zancudomyces culisetae]
MLIGFFLIFIGLYGFIFNRNNYLLIVISIEIILLGTAYILSIFSINNDDIIGLLFILYIIAIAAAEVALALSILVTMSRLRGSIHIKTSNINTLKYNPKIIV